ncbi:MAG: TlpA family protein disulfide reductase [Fidelibacterota bacterium]
MRLFILPVLLITTISGADSLSVNPTKQLSTGTTAPGCYARTLDGKDFFLSRYVGPRARPDLKGPIVFSFFTSYCVACRKEIPYLHTLSREYPEIRIYLVNVGEDPHTVQAYIRKMNYTLPVLLDRYGKIAENFTAQATPTLVGINVDGEIVCFKQGFSAPDTTAIRTLFNQLAPD